MDRDTFLSKRRVEMVPIPEWDTEAHVRIMSGTDRFRWHEAISGEDDSAINQARLLAYCLCDEHGTRLFDDSDETLKQIADKDSTVLDRLAIASMKLNAIHTESSAELKKDSPTPASDSHSLLPDT